MKLTFKERKMTCKPCAASLMSGDSKEVLLTFVIFDVSFGTSFSTLINVAHVPAHCFAFTDFVTDFGVLYYCLGVLYW